MTSLQFLFGNVVPREGTETGLSRDRAGFEVREFGNVVPREGTETRGADNPPSCRRVFGNVVPREGTET